VHPFARSPLPPLLPLLFISQMVQPCRLVEFGEFHFFPTAPGYPMGEGELPIDEGITAGGNIDISRQKSASELLSGRGGGKSQLESHASSGEVTADKVIIGGSSPPPLSPPPLSPPPALTAALLLTAPLHVKGKEL
jgi:hypothetical protein